MIKFSPKKINSFPIRPGVYIMKNRAGQVIYVGKASSLRHRVKSYWQGKIDYKTTELIARVFEIIYQETASVVEAMILESRLIKKHQPKYNLKDKDDKSRLYVWFSREKYPRIEVLRETDLPTLPGKNPKIFGPFFSAQMLKSAMELIRRSIPYRSCRTLPKHQCLYGHLGLCEAPCESQITPLEYRQRIRWWSDFFSGHKERIIKSLEREMRQTAKNHKFEKAAILRDRIRGLKHIKDIAAIRKESPPTFYRRAEGYDISNIQGAFATGSLVVFINGEPEKSEYRKFKIKSVAGANDVAMLAEVLRRRLRHSQLEGSDPDYWPLPDLIVIDGGRGQVNAASKVLKEFNWQIPLLGLAKGPDRKQDQLIIGSPLPERNPALFKSIRDEAHRFAIGYYRKLHRKTVKLSGN